MDPYTQYKNQLIARLSVANGGYTRKAVTLVVLFAILQGLYENLVQRAPKLARPSLLDGFEFFNYAAVLLLMWTLAQWLLTIGPLLYELATFRRLDVRAVQRRLDESSED